MRQEGTKAGRHGGTQARRQEGDVAAGLRPGRGSGATGGLPTSALRQPGFCLAVFLALATFASLAVRAQEAASQPQETQPTMRFTYVDVFIDAGEQPLAAYQFELSASQDEIKIVGVEGGEHPAFAEPPYYDPKALQNDRIIIAAFDTGDDLPTGKTRVARVHLAIVGDAEPQYEIDLQVAAAAEGKEIAATATVAEGESK